MKMQIERILTSALALGLCIGMTACGEEKPADETTAETTAVTTTAPETTAETTVETTAPETEEEKIGINQDLVSEYGQTFAEISAKHGKIIRYVGLHGGPFFEFETGYGVYFFYGTDTMNPNACDTIEETGQKIPLPDDDFKCINIEGIKASDFFDREFETLTPQDVGNIKGMQLHNAGRSELAWEKSIRNYYSTYSYDAFSHENTGFTGDNTIITMYQVNDGIIDSDTMVSIDLWATFANVYLGTTAEESPTDAG